MKSKLILATTMALASAASVFGGTIDFEAVPVGSDVGSYYQGATFLNDTVIYTSPAYPGFGPGNHELTSGNPNAFPDTFTLQFTTPQTSLSFYYTAYSGMTVTAFGTSANTLSTTNYPNNTDSYSTGTATPETITSGSANISYVTFTGLGSGYFAVDSISAAGISGAAAPEATSTIALLGVAAVGLFALRRKLAVQ